MNYFKKFIETLISVGYSYIPPLSSGQDGYTIILPTGETKFISTKDILRAQDEAAALRVGFIRGENYIGFTEDSPDGYKPSQLRYEHFVWCLKQFIKWNV